MSELKYTKEECSQILIDLQNEIGWDKTITQKLLTERKLNKTVYTLWGNMTKMKNELNLPISNMSYPKKYTDEELLLIIKNFENKYGFFPNCGFWDKNHSRLKLPNTSTFIRHFGSWHKLRKLCENHDTDYIIQVDGKYVNKYGDKQELILLLNNYYNKYHRVPRLKDLCKENNYDLSRRIKKHFGSYDNFIIENGFIPVDNRIYTDEDLENAFRNFIKENKRVPTIRELKTRDDLPGEHAYKLRFGTWGQACIYYGYLPNRRKPEYYLDNGERCDSSYECIVSNWLINNNINYERNIEYRKLDNKYEGRMNCDYLIHTGSKDWYIEIVGMLSSRDYIPTTYETKYYYNKMMEKEKILQRNKLNYRFIYSDDFKKNTIDELFNFL